MAAARDAATVAEAQVARLLAAAAAHAEPADLPWLVAAYEGAQHERIALGEQLRAAHQGRAAAPRLVAASLAGALGAGAPPDPYVTSDADALLKRVRIGADDPTPPLGAWYRRAWAEEQAAGAAMKAGVTGHPAWPWLEQVRGIGATLSARLLVRLDVRRAAYPSSFWRYCGLATVEAPGVGGRVARSGGRRPYDRQTRALCHLVGVSILRRGGAYKAYYRAERARLDDAHAEWSAGRRYLAALRRMEKCFLAHLWVVWRAREGLDVGAAHPNAAPVSPWDMVG